MTRFKNKVALITGGGSGMGRATAIAFAKEGASVIIFDINSKAAIAVSREIEDLGKNALPFIGDIGRREDAENCVTFAIEKYGRLDYVFNNAGTELVAPILETSEDQWDIVLNTNLKGTFMLSKAAVAYMVRTGGGVIINNASDAGMQGVEVTTAYSASKAGIIQLTRSIALDYAAKGIRCNCICPGCIDTPLCRRFNAEVGIRTGRSGEQALQEFLDEQVPMKRTGKAEEVASVVLFLCSDDAAYINGATITIDGGLTAGIGV